MASSKAARSSASPASAAGRTFSTVSGRGPSTGSGSGAGVGRCGGSARGAGGHAAGGCGGGSTVRCGAPPSSMAFASSRSKVGSCTMSAPGAGASGHKAGAATLQMFQGGLGGAGSPESILMAPQLPTKRCNLNSYAVSRAPPGTPPCRHARATQCLMLRRKPPRKKSTMNDSTGGSLQTSECSELLDPTGASIESRAQHTPGKYSHAAHYMLCQQAARVVLVGTPSAVCVQSVDMQSEPSSRHLGS